MFYKIDKDGNIIGSSNVFLDENYIFIDFNEEDIEKINKKWIYIDGKLIKGENAILFEEKEKKEKKEQISIKLGELKQKLDGFILLGENTTEIEIEIESLKQQYFSI